MFFHSMSLGWHNLSTSYIGPMFVIFFPSIAFKNMLFDSEFSDGCCLSDVLGLDSVRFKKSSAALRRQMLYLA